MKYNYAGFFFLSVLFLFTNCSEPNTQNNGELVDVAYFVPIYESATSIASRVTVDEPQPYQQSGKVITYGNYILINKKILT